MKRNIAALTFELSVSGNTIQLLPSGSFRAQDGRPTDCKAWQLDAAIAQNLIALAAARKTPLVIDYEHQTLRAATNGQPAPASGWFKTLTYRDGAGLFATDVEWTEPARLMIANKEYRFISAVFTYDKQGRIREILHAALTNTPALDGMDEVTMAALSSQAGLSESPTLTGGTAVDEELLERLRWMLNMPITSTAEEVIAELNKAIDMLSGGAGMAAASVNLIDLLKSKGCHNIKALVLVAAPEGVRLVNEAHPDVMIYTAALDSHLNEHGYIIPGLGDAGDKIFGSVQKD